MKQRFQIFPVVLLAVIIAFISIFAGCSGDSGSDGGTPQPSASPTGNGTISGRITDEGGGPIKGATVTVQVPQKGARTYSTDDNGEFIVEDLATGIQYYLVISSQGRVTLKPVFVIDENSPQISFEVTMPQGSGTVEFAMPKAVTLAEPVMVPETELYYYNVITEKTPYGYDLNVGMDVDLKWENKGTKSFNFEKYVVFRSRNSTVGLTDGTAISEITDEFTVSCTDALPGSEFGKYYYRVYKSYLVQDVGVRVMVGSNIQAVNWDKYVFNKEWDLSGGGVVTPTALTTSSPSPSPDPQDSLRRLAIHEGAEGVDAIYVTDYHLNEIHKIDPATDTILTWGSFGEGDTFNTPMAIGTDDSGKIYVVDNDITKGSYRFRIIVLNPDGSLVTQYRDLDFPYEVTDIAVGGGETPVVYVSSGPYIYRFDTATQEMSNINWEISGEYYHIRSMYLKNGKLYLSLRYYDTWGGSYYYSCYNMIINTSGVTISPLAQTGGFSAEYGDYGIAADTAGNVYFSLPVVFGDQYSQQGNLLDAIGFIKNNSQLKAITFFGELGDGEGKFLNPGDICVDSEENVYIVDTGNRNVQKIILEK